jgi:hypothetical protein
MRKFYYLDVHFKDGTKVEITPSLVVHTWPAPSSDQEACEEIARRYFSAPEYKRQRDELLELARQMCNLLEDLEDGYPSEIPTIEKFRDKLAAIARATSGKERG